ncbi:MAG: quinone oxidoreductase [Maricaulaceae bacterium]|jgi:NADPH2:quinone reductase
MTKTRAIRVHEFGGPEKLVWEEIDLPTPGEAVGVNFIDVYQRTGLYKLPTPFVAGQEAAGVVEAVGPGVTGFAPGERVAARHRGSYSEHWNVPARRVVKLPTDVTAQDAAAVLLKGLTAEMLLFRVVEAQPGWTVLVQAAAGGVGLILTRWATALGCTVIGTAGSEEKAELARAAGCKHVILYREEDVAARVRELTDGAGVKVAYDSVGASTQAGSLDSLATRGWYVTFGNASGPAAPVKPLDLLTRGSLFMTRPSLEHYGQDPTELAEASARLFEALKAGHVRAEIGQTFALADAADAHRALEARQTTGATVLLP